MRKEAAGANSFEAAYATLNEKQKEAVDSIEGPVMVVAGPGTGKTTILTLRIAQILKETDTRPENILALTFTNSGVHAMRKKLLHYIGDDAYRVGIFTFHSFAEHIIREFSFYFPQLEFAQVISELEKVKILESIIKKGSFTDLVSAYDEMSSLLQIKKAIDDIKGEGIAPDELLGLFSAWEVELRADDSLYYKRNFGAFKTGDIKPAEEAKVEKKLAKARELALVFRSYQEELTEKGLYDFPDMILSVLSELEENDNLKLDLQEQYHYLLIDEHQDTNEGQNHLIELMSDAAHLEGRPNVFVVGDEKQSIYRFQGASSETFRQFAKNYVEPRLIYLEENYRSVRNILDASDGLIRYSMEDAAPLRTTKMDTAPIQICEFSNYKYELLYISNEIKQKLADGVDPTDIAVIYRANKHIDDIKTVFGLTGIHYTVLSKDKLFADSNVQNLVSLLRVIHDPDNDHHLGKALFIDFLGFDPYEAVEALRSFRLARKKNDMHLFEILSQTERYKAFIQMLKTLKTHEQNNPFGVFFKEFLEHTGYLEHMLGAGDSRSQLEKVDTLYEEIKRQSAGARHYGLGDFLTYVDACEAYNIDVETAGTAVADGVMCMTAHRSKGLEFAHVYIVDATRTSWEKRRGGNSIQLPIKNYKGTLDDERRLFYVAMTRAKRSLTITSSLSDWEGKEREKSQFVTELNEQHVAKHNSEAFEQEHRRDLALFVQHRSEEKTIFDTDYLRTLFLEQRLSVTALNNYLQCEMRYLFKSLIHLPSEYSASLQYGDLVHTALEKFFDLAHENGIIPPKQTLIDTFVEGMHNAPLYGYDHEKYLARGRAALDAYYDAYCGSWSTHISTETRIMRLFRLENGDEITLSGILDKIEYLDSEHAGRVRIIDYKTGKVYSEKSSKEQKKDLERQIIFYHLLMEDYRGGAFTVTNAVLDFIEKSKKGTFEQHTFEVTNENMDTLKTSINEMASAVMSGVFLERGCQKRDCEYCALRTALG